MLRTTVALREKKSFSSEHCITFKNSHQSFLHGSRNINHDADDDGGCEEEKKKDDKQRLIREVKGGERKTERDRNRVQQGLFPSN